jgi:hypothetical protein
MNHRDFAGLACKSLSQVGQGFVVTDSRTQAMCNRESRLKAGSFFMNHHFSPYSVAKFMSQVGQRFAVPSLETIFGLFQPESIHLARLAHRFLENQNEERAHLSFLQGRGAPRGERAGATGRCAKTFPNRARPRLLAGSKTVLVV